MLRIATIALSLAALTGPASAHPGHGGGSEALHALDHAVMDLAPMAALLLIACLLAAALLRRRSE